ncbi:MAG: hypothetical protein U1E06_15420 [Tabrizicola sp.]|uniref:hypothetical protein n=1 Tax=Tabrizicola sp. TaxID=2005166 RepID=UPI002732EBC5|nr:hypothetical protein [Tabrizicola sp.]MDP3263869.1 hypothetical protein [Tabrizicola sp.]MDP3647233.1 hypothetical protein [Paracoccaceae bacterium]MDZ4068215.1 hypothetical protein [Tabrizicola sp.]
MTKTDSPQTEAKGQMPFRRHVFYLPGYDPFPPRRYRELYRKEAAAQLAVTGGTLRLAPKGAQGWTVSATLGTPVTAEIEVLVWSDIVQGSMDQGIAATYWQLFRTARTYIASGALARLMKLRKGPMIAALYPIAVLILQALIALAAGAAVGAGATALSHPALGLIAGLAAAYATLRWFRAQDHRIFAHYLMHDYAFTAALNGANSPALEARMAEFRARIAASLTEGADEVLVVGHSSGAHLAVSILADLLRADLLRDGLLRADLLRDDLLRDDLLRPDLLRADLPAAHPALGFLSLGQVIPMVSFLPDAHRLRADLAYLSTEDRITWVDVTAPGDGCAFALCDPVAVSGVAPPGKRWPLVLSAAFTQTLSPERWKALRWKFFRLHFQYLCAFDRPGDYDYFAITAGPLTLAQRFAHRQPSKSRIETPVNRYRDVA